MKTVTFFVLSLTAAACSAQGTERTDSNGSKLAEVVASPQLAAAQSLVGHYTGSSINYGLDEAGELVQKGSFTEDIIAENPRVENGRAVVSVTDIISGIDFPVKWTEGYLLGADGSIGDRFFETQIPGQPPKLTVEKDLHGESESCTFESDPFPAGPHSPSELDGLGFAGKEITFAKHTTVKNVVKVGNVERHLISQVTTVVWKDASGALQTKTFVSRNGFQERTLTR